jgi:hypothetical protein
MNTPARAAAQQALVWLCRGDTDPARIHRTGSHLRRADWGLLLTLAIHHNLTCLLAEFLTRHRPLAPPRLARHLAGTLRANQHKILLYRTAAAEISRAAGAAAVPVAAHAGIAWESALYGGTGARQLSDIDLLTTPAHGSRLRDVLAELGYRPAGRSGLVRPTRDLVLPAIHVDVHTHLPGTRPDRAGEGILAQMLDRRVLQRLPGHDVPLPVLAAADAVRAVALRLTVAPSRTVLADAADLARLHEHVRVTGPASDAAPRPALTAS